MVSDGVGRSCACVAGGLLYMIARYKFNHPNND